MKKFLLFIVLFFACSFFGLPANSQQKIAGTAIKITQKDNGKTISVKVNETFDITFTKECVGCRYVWETNKIDTSNIAFITNTYSNRSCTDCAGGYRDNTFHFRIKRAGKSTLSFSYFKKEFSVTVIGKK